MHASRGEKWLANIRPVSCPISCQYPANTTYIGQILIHDYFAYIRPISCQYNTYWPHIGYHLFGPNSGVIMMGTLLYKTRYTCASLRHRDINETGIKPSRKRVTDHSMTVETGRVVLLECKDQQELVIQKNPRMLNMVVASEFSGSPEVHVLVLVNIPS
jgi:hypothetical protein